MRWQRHQWWWYQPETGAIVPVITGGMDDPQIDQAHFARVADDGSLTAATLGTEDANWSEGVDSNFRIRFSMDETAVENANGGSWQLQYNRLSAGWNNVDGASSVARSSDSTHYADNDAVTTQRLSSSTGSFENGAADDADGVMNDNMSGGNFSEYEYCLQIRGVDVSNGDTIQFRVVWSGTQQAATYSQTPTVTATKPGPVARRRLLNRGGNAVHDASDF